MVDGRVATAEAANASVLQEAAGAATVRRYRPVADHAAVVDICRNVYNGTDELPNRINGDAARPDTHILAADTAADGKLDALLCCQQRGDVLWLYGARTREDQRGRGLASLLLEEAEGVASALPGVSALLSITVTQNHTMRRLFARRGFRQQGVVLAWPPTPVREGVHLRLTGSGEAAQQAQQGEAQAQREQQACPPAPASFLDALPEVAAVAGRPAARQLLPHWRRCESAAELAALLGRLRQPPVHAAHAGGDAACAADEQAVAATRRLPANSNAFQWLPAQYDLLPAGGAEVAELIQRGQVWLLHPPETPSDAAASAQRQQQQQQQQSEQGKQHPAGELPAAALVFYGPGYGGARYAGLAAGSRAAVEAALLHSSTQDPHCCRFYIDCCDRFDHEALWASAGGDERFDILPYWKAL